MSFSSRLNQSSVPVSVSEPESNNESLESDRESDSSPHIDIPESMTSSSPIEDFRRNLQNEKNIRRHINRLETLPLPRVLRNDKAMDMVEKNYKLQIQTLLEEVNQLKLDKKILEKKMEKKEKSYKDLDSPKKLRSEIFNDSFLDESIMKKTIDAKSSTIKELEFQLSQLKKDNNNMKMKLDIQNKQMEGLFKRLTDAENLKEILQEKNEEISRLQDSLEAEELKNEKISQELTYLKNENIALKLKSACPTCGQVATGANSFINPHCNCFSKDLSFFSSIDKCGHYKGSSDAKFISKILNFSEINDDFKFLGSNSPINANTRYKPNPGFTNKSKEFMEPEASRTKTDLSQLQNLSVKVLADYEEGIKKEKNADFKKDPKTLDRIIEVNKVKSYVIEAQNKKLMSLLKAGSGNKSMSLEVLNA